MESSSNVKVVGDLEVVTSDMSVSGSLGGVYNQPIHESLTLAALISGGFVIAQGTTIDNASNHDWEYIRGAVWNDDPDCLLFKEELTDNNHWYALGAVWGRKYTLGKTQWRDLDRCRLRNPTGRSHYGDLQFLHCMASGIGELPGDTKRKLMVWLEVMYKLANGEDNITSDTEVGSTKLSEFCPIASLPPRFMSLRYLLSKESRFHGVDVGRRALGSMFHVIQDSYAVGHTHRELLNEEDKISDKPLKFKPGTSDNWGAIMNFHTYGGQDGKLHEHYDHMDDKIPKPDNLGDLSQFDGLVGCRIAIEKCRGLMALKQEGRKWDDGVREYLDDQVFALSKNATSANNEVW